MRTSEHEAEVRIEPEVQSVDAAAGDPGRRGRPRRQSSRLASLCVVALPCITRVKIDRVGDV